MPASTLPVPQTVIVCYPADHIADWFTAAEIVDHHLRAAGTPLVRFPVRRGRLTGWVTRWRTGHLIDPVRRFGTVTRAAGGRVSRLDLTRAVAGARDEAILRWRTWYHRVHATPRARTWQDFFADHTANPTKLGLDEARRRFEAQPRVLALLAHNAHPGVRFPHDPYDLEAFQAGETTYTTTCWMRQIAGDALITGDGRLLQPQSRSVADTLRYLQQATAYIHTLTQRQHLIAIAID
jgi:hypothetical protein